MEQKAGTQRQKRVLVPLAMLATSALVGIQMSLDFLQVGDSASAGRRQMLSATLSAAAGIFGFEAVSPQEARAEGRRIAYPPIDRKDKSRCVWKSSAMGQANAARDKLFDLRECKLAGTSAADKDIAGVLMNDGDFKNVNFENAVMSKAVALNATFDGASFKNAVVDRATFTGSSMKGVIFKNAVITGSTFEGADLENADFTDAYIAAFDVKPLCKNPTMKGTNPVTGADTFESAGCFNQGLAR